MLMELEEVNKIVLVSESCHLRNTYSCVRNIEIPQVRSTKLQQMSYTGYWSASGHPERSTDARWLPGRMESLNGASSESWFWLEVEDIIPSVPAHLDSFREVRRGSPLNNILQEKIEQLKIMLLSCRIQIAYKYELAWWCRFQDFPILPLSLSHMVQPQAYCIE